MQHLAVTDSGTTVGIKLLTYGEEPNVLTLGFLQVPVPALLTAVKHALLFFFRLCFHCSLAAMHAMTSLWIGL